MALFCLSFLPTSVLQLAIWPLLSAIVFHQPSGKSITNCNWLVPDFTLISVCACIKHKGIYRRGQMKDLVITEFEFSEKFCARTFREGIEC